ncbi:hypothetical protein DU484_00365 (plasmid) [Haloplanus rubicundus]|uniref:Uncharacterized protein n=1 Tax=Haloplanus rubicundus TaxID=1547898 RepID=A0A345E8A0_9EURY|nr:hypothetical protein DU484_00365 [Haloplanus rubicundus]
MGSTLLSASSLGEFDPDKVTTDPFLRPTDASPGLSTSLPDGDERTHHRPRQRTVGSIGEYGLVLFETTSRVFALPEAHPRESQLLVETGSPVAIERGDKWELLADDDRRRTLGKAMIDDHANGVAHEVILSLTDGDNSVSRVNGHRRSLVRYWDYFRGDDLPEEQAEYFAEADTEELLGERVSALQLTPRGFVAIEHSDTPVAERGETTRRTETVLAYLLEEALDDETHTRQRSDEERPRRGGSGE